MHLCSTEYVRYKTTSFLEENKIGSTQKKLSQKVVFVVMFTIKG